MVGEEPINVTTGHVLPAVADRNNDGKMDILVGDFYSKRVSKKYSMHGNIRLFSGK